MKIDFTMGGLNIMLLIGIVILLQGFCLLFLQNPFKKIKHFGVRDFIILGVILALIVVGIICVVGGILSAGKLIG